MYSAVSLPDSSALRVSRVQTSSDAGTPRCEQLRNSCEEACAIFCTPFFSLLPSLSAIVTDAMARGGDPASRAYKTAFVTARPMGYAAFCEPTNRDSIGAK